MNISNKLGIAFVSSIFLVGFTAYYGMLEVEENFNDVIKSETLKVESALEMEINLNEAGSSLFVYLTDPNPVLLDRFSRDISELHHYFNQIQQEARLAGEGLETLEVVRVKITKFESSAENLISVVDRQNLLILERRSLLDEDIEPLLDNELQPSINENEPDFIDKLRAFMELEINIHELISAVRGYLLRHDAYLKDRIADSISDFEYWHSTLEHLELTPLQHEKFNKLLVYFADIKSMSIQILDMEDRKAAIVLDMEQLMAELDVLFDTKIQRRAENEIVEARAQTLSIITLIEWVIIGTVLLGLIMTYLIISPITRNIRELSRGIVDMRSGNAAAVHIDSKDEFGQLANAFNEMSGAIQEKTKSLEAINTELENQIAMRREAVSDKDKADAANEAKSVFLTSMSHEIRTPLNAVIGLTELTLRSDLSERQREQLKRVVSSGKNLLGLINHILDYSKIEAGDLRLESVDFGLDEVLSSMADIVYLKAEENGSEVIINVKEDVPTRLIGDPLRIGQILINLAGNAAKFTENGNIIITVEK
ncbi:hypothetical protein OLMES_0195 [Oleiphilus messinensis]|uniref:histidine kinase n=1 Tax=Oleiphilus messinensis TaxID=141451 RepID=A0A1Y0I1H9_9GAMM|nr:histidine kinase dimerization/phospho-acceptor domain-containing protein [Oleiphilus messinensis]ARU54302.1 hypothetical protein OLMES_0195 [Oleiphilus messinensis]